MHQQVQHNLLKMIIFQEFNQLCQYDSALLRYNGYFQQSVAEIYQMKIIEQEKYQYTILSDSTQNYRTFTTKWQYIIRIQIGRFFNFVIIQRVFRVYDCDSLSREFYEYMNNLKHLEAKDLKINPPNTKEYKKNFEAKLGGVKNKYLQNYRNILSFDTVWEDNSIDGQLNYYLADDTCKVKVVKFWQRFKFMNEKYQNILYQHKYLILTHYPYPLNLLFMVDNALFITVVILLKSIRQIISNNYNIYLLISRVTQQDVDLILIKQLMKEYTIYFIRMKNNLEIQKDQKIQEIPQEIQIDQQGNAQLSQETQTFS